MSWNKVESDVEGGPGGLMKWIAIFVIFFVVLFGGINFVMRPASVAMDNIVFENSYQRKEGTRQRVAILESQLAEIEMNMIKYPSKAEELAAQKRVIESQIRAVLSDQ